MSYSEVLTLPNLRDKLRPEVLQRVDQILADLPVEMRPLRKQYKVDVQYIDMRHVEYYDVKDAVQSALHNKRKEVAAVKKLIRILHDEYHAGHLDAADEELCLDRYNLDCRHRTLCHDVIVLDTSGQEIEGKIHNDFYLERRSGSTKILAFVDEAYMDSLIAPYKTPEGAKIPLFAAEDDVAEKKFRDNVLKAYGAKRGELAWCVVSGQWHKAEDITTFQFYKNRTGESTAQSLFGPPDNEEGHLLAANNGLPIHRTYAKSFLKSQMVLIPQGGPDDDQGSFSRWKLLFWDKFGSDDETRAGVPWGPKLGGRVLQFQNQFRPATRYLFFHYCMGVLDHQLSEPSGWWRTCFDDSSTSEKSTIVHLRKSIMRGVARNIGFLTVEEAAEFAAHNTFPRALDSNDSEVVEAVDDETMDAFLVDVSEDPGAPPPTSPLTEESGDSMDAIEVEIDGEIEVQGEDSEHWEEVDDEYEWEDTWVEVDEDVDEYADEVEDRDRDIY